MFWEIELIAGPVSDPYHNIVVVGPCATVLDAVRKCEYELNRSVAKIVRVEVVC